MVTKWLITGGCGFIGCNLISNLLKEGGHSIRVIDNLSIGTKEDLAQICRFSITEKENINDSLSNQNSVELIIGDILDEKLAITAAKGIDVIVHLAANTGVAPSVQNPRMDCITNVLGTLNYLEAARSQKVARFIFASSGAPIGEVTPPIHEEMAPHPVSPYGASKLAGEGYCSAYYRTFKVQTVCLRFGNVYGPHSSKKSSVIAKFIRKTLNGENLEIYGDGSQTRDFIYIDDLINAIRLSQSTDKIGGEVFQIATNKETTVQEIASQLISILHQNGINSIKIINSEKRLGDVQRNYSDTSKAKKTMEWTARYDIEKGLKGTVDWFLHHKTMNTKTAARPKTGSICREV